jgi:hypothetical protein
MRIVLPPDWAVDEYVWLWMNSVDPSKRCACAAVTERFRRCEVPETHAVQRSPAERALSGARNAFRARNALPVRDSETKKNVSSSHPRAEHYARNRA